MVGVYIYFICKQKINRVCYLLLNFSVLNYFRLGFENASQTSIAGHDNCLLSSLLGYLTEKGYKRKKKEIEKLILEQEYRDGKLRLR